MIKPVENPKKHPLLSAVEIFFGEDTPLKNAEKEGGRPYEPRPQQSAMSKAVAEALVKGEHLCIEAPTGVGKTFAYLVPAVELAFLHHRPVVVSTHTISLQEQILERDIPLLAKLTGRPIEAAIAKGRSNYLCLRRFHTAYGDSGSFLPGAEIMSEAAQLSTWAQSSKDGTLSDLEFKPSSELWEAVCCEYGNCLNAKCRHFKKCFFMNAREKLEKVQLIVANHALFFTDTAMKLNGEDDDDKAGILPSFAAVVLDEGHTIEDAAAERLGIRITSYSLSKSLKRLYNTETARGFLSDTMYTDERMSVIDSSDFASRYFARLETWLDELETNPLRYTNPGHIPNLLAPSLDKVTSSLTDLIEKEKDSGVKQELRTIQERVHDFRLALQIFLDMNEPDYVYWMEKNSKGQNFSMNAVPIEIGPFLSNCLFDQDFTVIITSATLAVQGNMKYFTNRIGCSDNCRTMILDSPYNFHEQVELHIPKGLPNPKDSAAFIPAACEQIKHYVQKTEGKAFVLFTSYSMLQEAAATLAEFFEEEGLQLLVQGEGMPRSRMVEEFRRDINSVLFGTSSFWTGVDVPGEALSNVIIVRLPFAVPDHPIIASRNEMITKKGGSPFREYALPEAVLKFRQGIGRLIRSRSDKGIITVLDNRIINAFYGKAFLNSIPPCKRIE